MFEACQMREIRPSSQQSSELSRYRAPAGRPLQQQRPPPRGRPTLPSENHSDDATRCHPFGASYGRHSRDCTTWTIPATSPLTFQPRANQWRSRRALLTSPTGPQFPHATDRTPRAVLCNRPYPATVPPREYSVTVLIFRYRAVSPQGYLSHRLSRY